MFKHGTHMSMQDFIACCETGGFIDDDGYGYYATETEMTNIVVLPSTVNKDTTYSHVVWFNR